MQLDLQRALIHGFVITMIAALALLIVTPPSGLTLGISLALGALAAIVTYIRERRS
jgi:hypothetical protein